MSDSSIPHSCFLVKCIQCLSHATVTRNVWFGLFNEKVVTTCLGAGVVFPSVDDDDADNDDDDDDGVMVTINLNVFFLCVIF